MNLQRLINPYELISTTLHNNEFSPSRSLFDLFGKNELGADDLNGTTSLWKFNDPNRFGVLDIVPSRPNEFYSKNSVPPPPLRLGSPTSDLESFSPAIKSTKPIRESNTSKHSSALFFFLNQCKYNNQLLAGSKWVDRLLLSPNAKLPD